MFLASPLLASLALEEVSIRLKDLQTQLETVSFRSVLRLGSIVAIQRTGIAHSTIQERERLPESQQNLVAELAKAESEKIVFEASCGCICVFRIRPVCANVLSFD